MMRDRLADAPGPGRPDRADHPAPGPLRRRPTPIDGSVEAVARELIRKDLLTAWQLEKLKKGDPGGFFFGGCKVLFHIAEGTFARVYRGRKIHGNQSVAIKVLRQRFVADAGAIARFNQEAESGLRLVHPNIVQIYEYGENDKRYFMVMEFVEGSNLRDFLRIRGRLTPTEALPLMLGLANGLKYSLDQGVTHRDLKATNILIASNGTAKLVDFGLATLDDEKKAAAAHGQRTVDYSALERTCGSPKGDKRSDIFFLGCVFYQMITGVLPIPEVETDDPLKKMLKRGINSIRPITEQRHAPDAELSEIIEKMMKVDLKARYQTMGQVVDDLEAYLERSPPRPPPSRASEAQQHASGPRRPHQVLDEDEHEHGVDHVDERKRLLCVEVQPESRTPSGRPSRRWATGSSWSPTPSAPPSATSKSRPSRPLRRRRPRAARAGRLPADARQGARRRPRPGRRGPPRPEAALPGQEVPDRRPPGRPAQAGQDEGDPGGPPPARPGRADVGRRGGADQPGFLRSGGLIPIACMRICRSSQVSFFQAGLRRSAAGW